MTKRSAEYGEHLKRLGGKLRVCKLCGLPRLRKRELVDLVDDAAGKKRKVQERVMSRVAAQLAGYCSPTCRRRAGD